ncbi:BRO1-like domain-containing protein [Obelidium mucronatum]|nr:BRO1-like domain-containing protein [Obelidium mucronatum]
MPLCLVKLKTCFHFVIEAVLLPLSLILRGVFHSSFKVGRRKSDNFGQAKQTKQTNKHTNTQSRMDPSQSLSGAPRSYQTLYDAASAAQIPFNHANAASALLSEGGRFLAFAAKRNNRRVDATNSFAPAASLLVHFGEALRRAASPVRASAGGSASASATARLSVPNLAEIRARPRSLSPNARRNRSDDALAATSSDGFLDFEKALVPLITGSRDLNSLKEPAQAQGHRCLSTSDIPIVSVSLSSQDGSRPPPVRRNPYSVEEHKRAVLNLPSSSQWSNLNALRIYAGAPERSEEGIEKLYQYYAQLVNLNKKFDFASGKANINFFWYEAFASDKMVTSSCIHYEMACVLFNVAAVYSQLACSQRLFTKEGKKMASDYFKKAAGVFVHLRDTHCQRAQIRLERTSDLTDQFLTAAGQIMLAQSMECYFERANDDKASSKTMSMVAAQTADYYEMALRHAKEGLHILTKQRFPKYWVQQLTAKSFMYAAIAHYHAPLQLGPNQALGERVARLVVSKELATRAVKSSKEVGGSVHEVVKGYLDVITSSHLLADAANFDKHNSAPVDESLVTLLQRPKEALVIPVAMASSMGDLSRFSDMFAGFKPMDEELDLGVLSTFAVEVVERASRSLVQMKKEIDEEIKSHASLETESLREILAANKIRAEAIAEHIQVIQGDEAIESYVDMKQKLEIIHISIIQYLHETRTILETTPASSLADNQTKSLHATLCKAVHQTQRLQTRRHSILTSLRAEYSSNTLSDFHPTEWTFENLKTIIPALDPNRDLEIDDIVSEKKRGNAVFELKQALATLEKLKADCTCKLDEIKNFVESMDTIRDHNAIHTQRLRLKLIKEAETSIQLEKQIAVQKIFDVLGTVKQISPKRQVEEQSRKTIISFENSIKAYKKFRSGITLEISVNIVSSFCSPPLTDMQKMWPSYRNQPN